MYLPVFLRPQICIFRPPEIEGMDMHYEPVCTLTRTVLTAATPRPTSFSLRSWATDGPAYPHFLFRRSSDTIMSSNEIRK